MSLRIYTDVDRDVQLTEYITIGTPNKLYIKNIGNRTINLYRVKVNKTDVSFVGWFTESNKSDVLVTNRVISPGEYIEFYLQSIDTSDILIKSKSIVDISMEYV